MGFKSIDLTGQKFGRLIAIRNTNTKNKWNTYIWECKCDCGKTVLVDCHKLRSGNTKSCGCLYIDKAKTMSKKYLQKHGKCDSAIYHIYTEIKSRCFNHNNKSYKYYGGRGITICDEWLNDFMSFYNWAINNGYEKGLSIERMDTNGNYEPSNCCWISMKEQQRNKRNNVYFDYGGNKYLQSDLCKKFKINVSTFRNRIKKGISVNEAINKSQFKEEVI